MAKKVKVRELPLKIREIKELKRGEESDLEEDVAFVPEDSVVESGGESGTVRVLGSGPMAVQPVEQVDSVGTTSVKREEEISGTQLYDAARGASEEEGERTYINPEGQRVREGGERSRPVRGNVMALGVGGEVGKGFVGDVSEGGVVGADVGRFQDKRARVQRGPDERRYEATKGEDMKVKRRKEMY